ncbi:MAG: NADH-ubiquinone oxidoreductase-F iron-sulfur binding region domain-containing protein [Verrucomicrobiota bacterium]
MAEIITSAKDLDRISQHFNSERLPKQILVCAGGGCVASGSQAVSDALQEEIKKQGLQESVEVIECGCMGLCAKGPVALVRPGDTFYEQLTPEDAGEIIEQHIKNDTVVDRLVHTTPEGKKVANIHDIPFFNKQQKTVLNNCGDIDPTAIEAYIAHDGYRALYKSLTEMTPEEVVSVVLESGLRGRGGAGFPTGLKWQFTQKAEGDEKYVLCNADEGDPGAFMDRSVLEGDPHSLIEAMAIAGYATGAKRGFVYVRAEYPLAVERLEHAIKKAREYGILGENVMGQDFTFELEIRMGSGAFVCGEETALMRSIEGKRGEPRPRPPFPANKGLWEKPSLLNNVETYANVPKIILNGAQWFQGIGTEKSKGTKVFALAGSITNSGLIEVPMGTALGDIIYDIGGGIPNRKAFKAAQIGGPSGGCIPREHLNVPVDYESLTELGAIMGSGGLVVMDEDSCMVDIARFFLEFVQEESCGKCTPCRVGSKRMLEMLNRICSGNGENDDIEKLEELGQIITDTALCGLGQTAPNPVLSTLTHFRDEYVAHIRDKDCPASLCHDLVRAPCQSACPAKVDVPGFLSLIGEERYSEAIRLHRERNPFAVVCSRVCPSFCESKCRRMTIDGSVAVRHAKRFMVEQEASVELPEIRENPANAERKIALIGGGPASLACGFFLARLGYKPTLFEAEEYLGGMMMQGIPAYRLRREPLGYEIWMIKRMGVDVKTPMRLGEDFTLESLRNDGYEAAFCGIGASHGTPLKIKGAENGDVMDALQFLRDYNIRYGELDKEKMGKKVAVIGGGNAAIDAARSALRLGAEEVSVIYRRSRENMPAYEEEVEDAIAEGIDLELLTSPEEIIKSDGKIMGVKCRRMELGPFDSSGRRRPAGTDQTVTIEADTVIAAIGQDVKADQIITIDNLELTNDGRIKADPTTGVTSVPWLFAGGDCTTGPASLIEAVAAGERAAAGIDEYLTGEEHAFWRVEKVVDTHFDPNADPFPDARAGVKKLHADERADSWQEVEHTWEETLAIRQAKRCLRCDYRPEEDWGERVNRN